MLKQYYGNFDWARVDQERIPWCWTRWWIFGLHNW